jgi:dihydropteroate synthase
LEDILAKPNAEFVTEEELDRIVPAVKSILKHYPEAMLSIDTFRSGVAKACIEKRSGNYQ